MRIARLAAVAAIVAVPSLVQAQSGSIQALATVVTPLVVTGNAPLAFGNVFQGVTKTVASTDAASGRLSVTGFDNSQVALTFTLPSNLVSGGNNLPIDNWDVRSNGTNVAGSASALSVTSGAPVNANLVSGNLYLFVGGRVSPAVGQVAGSYAATITLAAAYTGF
ncbi:MAG: hypothetical protein V4813_13400 [Gemmatimonadota bacterium]